MLAHHGKRSVRHIGFFASSVSPAFAVTSGLVLFYLLAGGSSRFDVLSLPVIRFVSVLATFYGVWRLPPDRHPSENLMIGLLLAIGALVLFYLLPLPPSLWSQLSGRGIIAEVDRVAQLGTVYRPLSMSPILTQNAFFALFVPASILFNGLRLTNDEVRQLAPVVMIGALASCILAIAQLLGPSDGVLYLYQRTSNGAANGLFANRNHHAVFLASILPIIVVYAASANRSSGFGERKAFAALLLACLIAPMLLVIGSRGGFAAAIVAVICLPFLYIVTARRSQVRRSERRLRIVLVAGVLLMALVILWAIFSPRAETLVRVTGVDADPEMRFKVWPVVLEHIRTFGFWGPGPGTYEVAYKLIEPDVDLRPTYSNHAHNDWLEVVFTLGVPGGLLLLAGVSIVTRTAAVLIRRRSDLPDQAWGWVGIVMLIVFGVGSVGDYPLRVPSLLALMVIACLWMKLGATRPRLAVSASAITD